MGTIADKLELLRRTKERQRAYLEQKYPLLDFDNIPFRAYLDLFQGRSYIPGFVGGWKAYGRSNDEDASTRDILPDYSGNGRDIKLYNFAFAGMSGYGGYPYDFKNFTLGSITSSFNTVSSSMLTANAVNNGVTFFLPKTYIPNGVFKARVKITGLESAIAENLVRRLHFYSNNALETVIDVTTDGIHDIEYTLPAEATHFWIFIESFDANFHQLTTPVVIEELPDYPGALVSDGVDDYGQCIKDFALPDDYTVVAIRKIPEVGNPGLASKGKTMGAFLFEAGEGGVIAWSYGASTSNSTNTPALFSYQSKNSYNGTHIESGTATDNEDDKLYVFSQIGGSSSGYILYDLRIYDHSLTAEELQTVKDEMMTDYENATGGGIADITYVADWDAKGRSNDEEETVRSQWIDKVNGRVINLNNYSFSEMSGWGGYAMNWADGWSPDYFNIIQYTLTSSKGVFSDLDDVPANQITLLKNANANIPAGTIIRLSITGLLDGERLAVTDNTNPDVSYSKTGNGILEFTPENTLVYVRMTVIGLQSKANRTISIEQLPLYPGALVNDGVDDRGLGAEPITEEIKTVVMHLVGLAPVWTFFIEGADGDQTKRIGATYSNGKLSVAGIGDIENDGKPYSFIRNVPIPYNILYIGCAGENTEYGKSAVYRLIFIKEQLDEYQQEFLMWKVSKEYRDWCRENGYDYAITEMTEDIDEQ